MSYPEYLTKIINFQSQNKQVQSVRQQIAKFLPKIQKQTTSQRQILEDTKGKTMMNFNVRSISKPASNQNIFWPFQTASNISKDLEKRKVIIPFAKLNDMKTTELQQDQEQKMLKWREQMLSHLKPKIKTGNKQSGQLQKNELIRSESPKLYEEQYQKQSIFKLKKSQTLSNTMVRSFKTRIKSKHQTAQVDSHAFNQDQQRKKIIIINPKPLYEQQRQKEKVKFTIFKTKKSALLFKKKKSEQNLNMLKSQSQSHANFTALIPFFGAKKAIAEPKFDQNEYRKKMLQIIQKQRLLIATNKKLLSKPPERVIQISAWQTNFQ